MSNDLQDRDKTPTEKKPTMRPAGPNLWVLVALLASILVIFFTNQSATSKRVNYAFFKKQLAGDNVEYVIFEGLEGTGRFRKPPIAPPEPDAKGELKEQRKDGKPVVLDKNFLVTIPDWIGENEKQELDKLLKEHTELWDYRPPSERSAMLMMLLSWLLPILLFVFLWSMFRRTRDQIMGGGFLSGFSKSPAKKYESS
ncbi:MAG: ATP-dependent metallopeptidase FtsH/Yme1/Tma family protein, partial [Planctomycetales bacterium]|nr:ATP-dependent metallopeptidase FtsH/Yme1/Tma family protein [Planctomycetales bacterium]